MKNLILILILILIKPVFAHNAINDSFQASRDYRMITKLDDHRNNIKNNIKKLRGKKIIVTEFFSYGCPACFTLEPYLNKWLKHKPDNVIFKRIPVLFEPDWDIYAKTYLVLTEIKLESALTPLIFNAIHLQHQALNQINSMANFLAQNSLSLNKAMFNQYYYSGHLATVLAENEKIIREAMIFQVPAFTVNQQYVVDLSFSGGNMPRLLQTVDDLIDLIKKDATVHTA